MMRFVRILLGALVATSFMADLAFAQSGAPAQQEIVVAQARSKARASAPRNTGTHVYLLRGFMDIFSTGMDDLGVKMNRRGIRASVHNHGEFLSLADSIGARHRQGVRENVVIIGHSLGANDAFRMAERLGDFGVTVPLIITYDPTAPMSVGRNVARVVNFYSSTNGWGTSIERGPGFRGSLNNIDLSRRGEIGHTDIDKSPALHSQSIGYVQSIGGRSRAASAKAEPKEDVKPDESAAKPDSNAAAQDAAPVSTASVPPAAEKTETAASPAAGQENKN